MSLELQELVELPEVLVLLEVKVFLELTEVRETEVIPERQGRQDCPVTQDNRDHRDSRVSRVLRVPQVTPGAQDLTAYLVPRVLQGPPATLGSLVNQDQPDHVELTVLQVLQEPLV